MPIPRELRHFYRGPAWEATRERIRQRACDCCERCGKPNGERIETVVGKVLRNGRVEPYMFWRLLGRHFWDGNLPQYSGASKPEPSIEGMFRQTRRRYITAKCGAAHLNHTPGDDRDENLVWLCDWCHFHLDREHHHQTRARRKDQARPILVREVA